MGSSFLSLLWCPLLMGTSKEVCGRKGCCWLQHVGGHSGKALADSLGLWLAGLWGTVYEDGWSPGSPCLACIPQPPSPLPLTALAKDEG